MANFSGYGTSGSSPIMPGGDLNIDDSWPFRKPKLPVGDGWLRLTYGALDALALEVQVRGLAALGLTLGAKAQVLGGQSGAFAMAIGSRASLAKNFLVVQGFQVDVLGYIVASAHFSNQAIFFGPTALPKWWWPKDSKQYMTLEIGGAVGWAYDMGGTLILVEANVSGMIPGVADSGDIVTYSISVGSEFTVGPRSSR